MNQNTSAQGKEKWSHYRSSELSFRLVKSTKKEKQIKSWLIKSHLKNKEEEEEKETNKTPNPKHNYE